MEKLAQTVNEFLLAEDEQQLVAAIGSWIRQNGLSLFNVAVDAADPIALVTTGLSGHEVPQHSGYQTNKIYLIDPVAAYPFHNMSTLVWTREYWRVHAPKYYDYLTQETRIHGGISVPLRAGQKVSAATFFAFQEMTSPDTLATSAKLVGSAIAGRMAAFGRMPSDDRAIEKLRKLSDQQREILSIVSQGKSNAEVAIILGITKRAVDYHMNEIRSKLGVTTRTQASIMYTHWWN